ncbi:MAG: GNAT family N-acetyltransferase [Chloroflexi bacterium]|nr:GNAT family N-acetyltransferase [Chloroflexota bacterium]
MPDRRISIRPMTPADLGPAAYVRKDAMEWLVRSEGRDPWPWIPGNDFAQRHLLRTDPGGCWVAEINSLVVGFSQGFVRGDIWFLAQLFVHPEVHALGIGQELLGRAYAYGAERGAAVFSVVSSTSPVAQSLYMRAGMFAFAIGYRLTGSIESLLDLPEPDANKKTIVDCSGWQDRMADLDRATFGAERREDHAFYLDPASWPLDEAASFGLTRDGDFLGYGYALTSGFIAPIAAYEPADQLPLLKMCAGWLHDRGVTEGSIWVISHNQALLGALLSRGWKVGGWSFLKANRPFGKFDRYHPAGGILL